MNLTKTFRFKSKHVRAMKIQWGQKHICKQQQPHKKIMIMYYTSPGLLSFRHAKNTLMLKNLLCDKILIRKEGIGVTPE